MVLEFHLASQPTRCEKSNMLNGGIRNQGGAVWVVSSNTLSVAIPDKVQRHFSRSSLTGLRQSHRLPPVPGFVSNLGQRPRRQEYNVSVIKYISSVVSISTVLNQIVAEFVQCEVFLIGCGLRNKMASEPCSATKTHFPPTENVWLFSLLLFSHKRGRRLFTSRDSPPQCPLPPCILPCHSSVCRGNTFVPPSTGGHLVCYQHYKDTPMKPVFSLHLTLKACIYQPECWLCLHIHRVQFITPLCVLCNLLWF